MSLRAAGDIAAITTHPVLCSPWRVVAKATSGVSDTTTEGTTEPAAPVVSDTKIDDPVNWLIALVAIVVSIIVGTLVRRLIHRLAQRQDAVTSMVQIVARLVFGLIVAIGIAIALAQIGVDLTPLLASAGILGLTVGFALKDVAENYVSGIIMGFSNPFEPGDQVIVDDGRLEGTVEELQLRYTVVRSTDGVRILMPNSLVLKNPVENLTVNGTRRSHFTLGVDFDTDLDAARRLAVDTVKGVEGVQESPEPEAFVEELAGSWVTIRVRFWHGPRNHDRWEIRGRAITATFGAFNDAGINMPYRHRVLRLEGLESGGTDDRREVDDRSGDGSERG